MERRYEGSYIIAKMTLLTYNLRYRLASGYHIRPEEEVLLDRVVSELT